MRSRALVAVVALLGAIVTGGWLFHRGLRRDGDFGRARLFDDVFAHVSHDYVDSLSDGQLYQKATAGMLDELHDPYTVYLTSDRLRRLSESTAGHYAGIGVQIDVRDGWITVVTPLPGTPAERAGIQAGDRIVAINERQTAGWTPDEARGALRGGAGTAVALLVERPGVTARLPFRVDRAEIRVHSVRHEAMLTDGVGYLDLTIFSESSADELRTAIAALTRRGMHTLVFDLRENPGGLLEQGVAVSELFLNPSMPIVSMRGRAYGATRSFADDAPQPWPDLRVIALVDGHTASAAEIVAGALQDHDRALIIGATTYGKGSAQSVYPLRDSTGAVKMTTARWFTPSGRSIQKVLPRDTDDDDDVGPPDDSAREVPLKERGVFHTDAGRVVYGGGGITPDLIIASVGHQAEQLAFWRALGSDIPRFRDALTEYALSIKAAHGVSSPDFTVTPAMRTELVQRAAKHGVHLDRAHVDSLSAVVDRLLAQEVTRYAFGTDAEFSRAMKDDRVIATALELANGVGSQRALLARAAERRAAKREDVPPTS